jgi:hypothetical protein
MFLTPDELQQLTGYAPNQRKRICDWLDRNGIPYRINRLGDPVVLKKSLEVAHYTAEPNFDFLKSA